MQQLRKKYQIKKINGLNDFLREDLYKITLKKRKIGLDFIP